MTDSDSLSDWIIAHEPPIMDEFMRSCWEEIWLRLVAEEKPGDVQALALIAWLNAYALDDEYDVFMEWQPGGVRFTLDDEGALLVETEDFMGRCNPYDLLDQLLIVFERYTAARPHAYNRLLETYNR